MSVKTPKIIAVTALALCLGCAFGGEATKAPPKCAALDVLTGKVGFTIEGEEVLEGAQTINFELVVVPGGDFSAYRRNSDTPGTDRTVAFLDGAVSLAQVDSAGIMSVIEDRRTARLQATDDILMNATHASGAGTLGLKGVGVGSFKLVGDVLTPTKLHPFPLERALSVSGVIQWDTKGRIAQIEWRPVLREPSPVAAYTRITYQYDPGDFSPGLPSGWISESIVGGEVTGVNVTRLSRFLLTADFASARAKLAGGVRSIRDDSGHYRITGGGQREYLSQPSPR